MLYYNNEIKNKYMTSLGVACNDTIRNYFKESAKMEEEKGKDIALFSEVEWFEYLRSIDVITINQVARRTDVFTKYAKWYFESNKLTDKNAFVDITKEAMIAYTTEIVNHQKYIPKDLLLKMIAEIPNAADRFMVLCLYEGIRGEDFTDIQLLKREDIDEENCVFHLNSGSDVKVSEELLNAALDAEKQKGYITAHSPFKEMSMTSTNIVDSEYIFKGRDNMNTDITRRQRVHTRFLYLKDFFENSDFSTTRIMNSGIVHRINEITEQFDIKTTRKLYKQPEYLEMLERFGYGDSEPRAIMRSLKVKGFI